MSQVMVQDSNEPDRPANNWKYAYVAGVVDFGATFTMNVVQRNDRAVGYVIQPQVNITSHEKTSIGFLDEFCEQHDVDPNLRQKRDRYKLEINSRDHIEKFLKLVQPYVIARHDEIEIMVKHLLPGLELGKGSSKKGFVELMAYVDEIRSRTKSRREPKYDQAYFKDEWNV